MNAGLFVCKSPWELVSDGPVLHCFAYQIFD
jgi:hypothetical protein